MGDVYGEGLRYYLEVQDTKMYHNKHLCLSQGKHLSEMN